MASQSQTPLISSPVTTDPTLPITFPPSSSPITFNIAAQAPLKLTPSNFLSWRLQFTTLLTGYGLAGHIDGSSPCPPSSTTVNGVSSINPAHIQWVRQDQLLLNAILGSLSPTLISFIATGTTAQDAWNTLTLNFGRPTRGRITHLKTQLNQMTKGSQSVTDFLHHIKIKIDELALMNAPVDIEDLIIKIFNALGDDYKDLAHAIQARDTPITFPDLHEKLLTKEAQLSVEKPPLLPLPTSANVATKYPYPNRFHHASQLHFVYW